MKRWAMVLALSLGLLAAWRSFAAPQDSAAPAQSPATESSATQASERSLDEQYAAAKLKLAEANLAKVAKMNERVANAVPGSIVADYRQDVDVARARVAATERGRADSLAVWLLEAERDAKSAQNAWRDAVAANDRNRGTIDPADVERLKLRAEVLRVNLERGRALADQPRDAQLAWRISALEEQVDQLNETVRRSPPRRPSPVYIDSFYWGPR